VIEGDGVYFDTSKVSDYGKLAHLDLEHLQEGARVERIEGKRNATDFALWKFERPGENRAMVWESPWAKRSFPGWHIECSAMAIRYLGDQFDIHTGGIDHIPVHHTNEIAQAEAATGKQPFVRYWVHHNFLRVDGEKMSKSLGNFYTIDDVLKRGIDPKALRLLFLTTHYRSEMNFTWDSVEGSQKAWQKLSRMVLQLRAEQGRTILSEDKLQKVDEYRQRFFDYVEDDLKTPEAITVMYEVIKSNIPGPDKYDLLVEFDEVLGLGLRELKEAATELPAAAQELLQQRQTAREQKDWAQSDALRDTLLQMGYEVLDSATGQQLRPIRPAAGTDQ
jgi:cysteinyl-tRNA synthetase